MLRGTKTGYALAGAHRPVVEALAEIAGGLTRTLFRRFSGERITADVRPDLEVFGDFLGELVEIGVRTLAASFGAVKIVFRASPVKPRSVRSSAPHRRGPTEGWSYKFGGCGPPPPPQHAAVSDYPFTLCCPTCLQTFAAQIDSRDGRYVVKTDGQPGHVFDGLPWVAATEALP